MIACVIVPNILYELVVLKVSKQFSQINLVYAFIQFGRFVSV